MMRSILLTKRAISGSLALASIALLPCTARAADPPSDVRATAEALYQEAYKLSQAGNFVEACKKLEESDKLDPATGTKVELAKCYEQTGRPASAWAMYVTAADADKLAGKNKAREAEARERAEALLPDLPRLIVNVPEGLTGLENLIIERDGVAIGKPLWGTAQPVDIGEHIVRAKAAGKLDWEGRVTASARSTAKLSLPEKLEDDPKAVRPPIGPTGPDKPISNPGSRAPAFIALGVGAASVVAGGVFGALAFKQWGEVEDNAASNCVDPASFKGCTSKLRAMGNTASTYATVSTITFSVGGAALATGALLWALRPSAPQAHASHFVVLPQAGSASAGLLILGRF